MVANTWFEEIVSRVWGEKVLKELSTEEQALLRTNLSTYQTHYPYSTEQSIVEAVKGDMEKWARIEKAILSRKKPGMGDFVLVGGQKMRIAHIWSEGEIQPAEIHAGSVYVDESGSSSFSGSLESSVKGSLHRADTTEEGDCWTFRRIEAGGGICWRIKFPVWKMQLQSAA